jgi:hypothetical protein
MKIVWGRSLGWNLAFNGISCNKPGSLKVMDYRIIEDGADWPRKSISGKLIWWEKAFRRRVWVVWGTGFHMEPETQYATFFDLLSR